jgi:hypothetical protein
MKHREANHMIAIMLLNQIKMKKKYQETNHVKSAGSDTVAACDSAPPTLGDVISLDRGLQATPVAPLLLRSACFRCGLEDAAPFLAFFFFCQLMFGTLLTALPTWSASIKPMGQWTSQQMISRNIERAPGANWKRISHEKSRNVPI